MSIPSGEGRGISGRLNLFELGTDRRKGLALQQVIQEVLETEAEAQRMVRRAKDEAEKILGEAQGRAKELLMQYRASERADAEVLIATAIRAAEEEKQARLAGVIVEINTQVRLDQIVRQKLIEAVVACICGLK